MSPLNITQPLGIWSIMATFSGDVQYSQNGTVTNPCIKVEYSTGSSRNRSGSSCPCNSSSPEFGWGLSAERNRMPMGFHPCKFHGGHHRFYFYFDKHLILYSHTNNYHDYPDLLNFLSLPLCHSEMVSTCRACLFCYFHGIYELLLQRRAVSRCPAKPKKRICWSLAKISIQYYIHYIYIIYIITCIYIYISVPCSITSIFLSLHSGYFPAQSLNTANVSYST